MLTLHRRMVAEDHVAFEDALPAEHRKAVTHAGADGVGDEDGHSAVALGDETAFVVGHADGVVLVFVDVGTEGGARHVGVDLVVD